MSRAAAKTLAELAAIADQVAEALRIADAAIGHHARADYWERRNQIHAALITELQDRLQARIDPRHDACRVRIGGLAASSTTGVEGALRNWIAAVRRKAAA
ncbi:Uncharacterised protein [Brevundimonas diminuta]|uniref:hypothetical protein n=1 Tax=Brevundimonas diminuta TaxID=293 RepID=UPI000207F7D5|nr:hypothetical protein [Brevundimonas diminuta]EGF94672.1 hypothetical protein BDIM_14960 [Brevundimonas diminuta ATCC 11568]OWR21769.1 hypothetical protein CD944_04935 [Brevundimonas diminuta]WQE46554.1 hypothetical protein U0020_06845 [Brevundimonas diminuta]SPU47988.1 Uncharacterised protein [Brevundimonas diminuta]SUW15808.1 Uncharacterised protein [Brevundimonas diminuta]